MTRKSTVAGLTSIALFIGCSGGPHTLGGDNQASENTDAGSGGADMGGNSAAGSPNGLPNSFAGSTGSDAGLAGAAGLPGAGGAPPGAAGATAVGGSPPGTAGSGSPGISITGAGGTANADFVGNWTGYVENAQFGSGSDSLLLSISSVSDAELSGQLTMGQGSGVLPVASIPTGQGGGAGYFDQVVEGHPYTAINGKVTGTRIEFDVALFEIWSSYCNAQVPYPGTTSCEPPSPSGYVFHDGKCFALLSSGEEEVDCTQLSFCGMGPCKCDDTHCFSDTTMAIVHFDMALRAPYLDGSVSRLPGGNGLNNVHFTPQ